jgi:DNA-binding transcriptional regulator YhcF (GntR family)
VQSLQALRFHQAIISNGFKMIEEDHCVYVKQSEGIFVILSLNFC